MPPLRKLAEYSALIWIAQRLVGDREPESAADRRRRVCACGIVKARPPDAHAWDQWEGTRCCAVAARHTAWRRLWRVGLWKGSRGCRWSEAGAAVGAPIGEHVGTKSPFRQR